MSGLDVAEQPMTSAEVRTEFVQSPSIGREHLSGHEARIELVRNDAHVYRDNQPYPTSRNRFNLDARLGRNLSSLSRILSIQTRRNRFPSARRESNRNLGRSTNDNNTDHSYANQSAHYSLRNVVSAASSTSQSNTTTTSSTTTQLQTVESSSTPSYINYLRSWNNPQSGRSGLETNTSVPNNVQQLHPQLNESENTLANYTFTPRNNMQTVQQPQRLAFIIENAVTNALERVQARQQDIRNTLDALDILRESLNTTPQNTHSGHPTSTSETIDASSSSSVSTDSVTTVPINTVSLDSVPLSTIPLSSVPIETVPLDTIPLDTVPVHTSTVDDRNISPLAERIISEFDSGTSSSGPNISVTDSDDSASVSEITVETNAETASSSHHSDSSDDTLQNSDVEPIECATSNQQNQSPNTSK